MFVDEQRQVLLHFLVLRLREEERVRHCAEGRVSVLSTSGVGEGRVSNSGYLRDLLDVERVVIEQALKLELTILRFVRRVECRENVF